MKVIILGAGQVGYNMALYLANEDHHVTVVDHSSELLKRISDVSDIQPILGHASHPEVLTKAGAANADLLIAVTGSDEVNMVACEVVNSLFEVKTKIARIRHQSYLNPEFQELFSKHHLSIDVVISPEIEIAKSIHRSLEVPGAFDVVTIPQSPLKIIGLHCGVGSPLLNTSLKLLGTIVHDCDFVVLSITRSGQPMIPKRDEQLLPGDDIYILSRQEEVSKVMAHFGYTKDQKQKCVIVGAGNVGLTLAKMIEEEGNAKARIIEFNPTKAEAAARTLKDAEVFCGDGLDLEILQEANISSSDMVVCVTADDKVNILSGLLCKRQGGKRSMVLLNNMVYAPLVSSLGVDAIISPKTITASTILKHIRQGKLNSLCSFSQGFGEILEIQVDESLSSTQLSCQDIQKSGEILLAAVIRKEEVFILPTKQNLQPGDRLILAVRQESLYYLEEVFDFLAS
ncbi:MAG TPA: Trk system potassium transporter TrkA [Alphaproteobacteria bacterium]|nr:Trk system potassium transporter TrkA [Alphaproteobacteria bacterium]